MTRAGASLVAAGALALAAPQAVAVQPAATATDWANAPLTPGGWVYHRTASNARSRATFGPRGAPLFEVACTNQGNIALFRHGAGAGSITVRTSATMKQMAGNALSAGLSVPVAKDDAILDAMAFSRGRYAIEAPRVAPLVVPAWPELARVVEDCRRS
jgi:hypothetical protein